MNEPTDGYEGSAHERWCATHQGGRASDKPRVSVWMPDAPPMAYLRFQDNGCQTPITLPPGPAWVTLTLGGVQFDGYLDDIELLISATADVLRWERQRVEELTASAEAHAHG